MIIFCVAVLLVMVHMAYKHIQNNWRLDDTVSGKLGSMIFNCVWFVRLCLIFCLVVNVAWALVK